MHSFVRRSAKNLRTFVLLYSSLPKTCTHAYSPVTVCQKARRMKNFDLLRLAFWLTVVQKYACANFLAFDFIGYLKAAEGIVWGEKYCNFVNKIQNQQVTPVILIEEANAIQSIDII